MSKLEQALSILARFEQGLLAQPVDVEKLLVQVFEACGYPVTEKRFVESQPGRIDCFVRTDIGGKRQTIAVEIKGGTKPAGIESVSQAFALKASGHFDRAMVISRLGFSAQAIQHANALDPRGQPSYRLVPDHPVEFGDDLASLDERRDASFDGCHCNGFRLGERIPSDCHETSDRSGGRDPLKVFGIHPFSPTSARRLFAHYAKRAPEALRGQTAPKFSAISAAGRPLIVEPGQMQGRSVRRRRLCCSITLAQPARHREASRKNLTSGDPKFGLSAQPR